METKDPKRRAGAIMASDTEWARNRDRAGAFDMPVSRFVLWQALATTAPQPMRLPVCLQ